ncbi:hypothetical protein DH2020_045747 [Rehmannia glutinosa]|uniref:3'-5' exonuclease domain-containing protein n=1 Tax=Rehmannia glutinosa TaxID=99300 RepID=A0ABR0UD80_REHGL
MTISSSAICTKYINLLCGTHRTYDVFFSGHIITTTVTHDPNTVSDWISTVKSENPHRLLSLIVGLDDNVEWHQSCNPHRKSPVVALQICIGRLCLIYQIVHTSFVPQSLIDFLDENFTYVGVDVKSDLGILDDEYGLASNARAEELGRLAADAYGREELESAGLKELASLVLGEEVEKPTSVMMSNWTDEWLTEDHVKYACIDALMSFEIGRILLNAPCSGY